MFCLVFQGFYFPFIGLDGLSFFFNGALAGFQVGQQILKGCILFCQMLLCVLYDIIRKPQLSGDGKCVTLSRDTDQQAVSGLQALYVKFTAGIFNAGG